MVVLDAEHHVGIHRDEAAVAVVGEALVAAPLASASTVSSLRPRLSTVSIMPGIEARAPERTETRSGLSASPKVRPAIRRRARAPPRPRLRAPGRIGAAVVVVVGADLGRDGEAGRHRQAEIGHLGEVGALAAEEVLLCRLRWAQVPDGLNHVRPQTQPEQPRFRRRDRMVTAPTGIPGRRARRGSR